MCIFSGPVESVAGTKIFARATESPVQFVAYSMTMKSKTENAMILPIPVKPNSGEKAVSFISLKEYPEFFRKLEAGFPQPRAVKRLSRSGGILDAKPKSKLEVHQVGAFDASFVPTIADFSRLDERFRLPDETWNQIPLYKNFGFVVFKFKEGENKPHPMAFQFPRADVKKLFFPTVHIHDGKVHAKAKFDHILYAQFPEGLTPSLIGWKESPGLAGDFVSVEKSKKMIDGDAHVYRKSMRGMLKNADVIV